METIYSSAATLCLITIICAILRVFFPGEKTVKVLSLILSLFVVLSVTSPLISVLKSILSESSDVVFEKTQKGINATVDEEVISEAGNYLSEYTYSLLLSGGYKPSQVSVNLNHNEKTGIYVDKLVIYFDSEYKKRENEIHTLVESSVGVKPLILYESKEGTQ